MHILKRPGNLLILILLLLAAGAALWFGGAKLWGGGGGPWLRFLGRTTGIFGGLLLLLSATLSVRIPGFDRPFGGLSELWRVHHVAGWAAFLLLLAHPILLALARLPISPRAPMDVLWPGVGQESIAPWLGWAGLLVMMLYLAPTFFFFGKPHYQRWKKLHAISGVAVLLGLAHSILAARTLPAWFWWLFGALTAMALAYRLVYRKIRPGRRFVVTDVAELADRVVEISLKPLRGGPLKHGPGQFIYLAPLDPKLPAGYGEEHPYTISSAPEESTLRTTVLSLGDASEALQRIEPGSPAWVDGPYGHFFENAKGHGELWIGGGIGITPFVSRARAFAHAGEAVDIVLVYCANEPDRAYYLDELRAIAARVPGFQVHPHYFRDLGPLASSWLLDACPDLTDREVYVCGPQPLIDIAAELCHQDGVPGRRFHSEGFDFL